METFKIAGDEYHITDGGDVIVSAETMKHHVLSTALSYKRNIDESPEIYTSKDAAMKVYDLYTDLYMKLSKVSRK